MPFEENQYKKYLEIAINPIEKKDYINLCWEKILPEEPRVCSDHQKEGHTKPLQSCSKCMRYNKGMTSKTVDNLIKCGFLIKKRGYVCPKHNRRRNGRLPKPDENCPDCKSSRGKICDYHQEIGLEDSDPDCPNCKEGFTSIEISEVGSKWLNGTLSGGFAELVTKSLKRSWGYQMRLPNAIDAALEILGEFSSENPNEVKTGTDIFESLQYEKDDAEGSSGKSRRKGGYDFNYAGEGSRRSLREFLKLLVAMNALEQPERNKYKIGKKISNIKGSLRKTDMINEVEMIINGYGPTSKILEDEKEDAELKTLFSKYYLYVQSGGIGKEQWFLRKIYKLIFAPVPEKTAIEFSNQRKRKKLKKMPAEKKIIRDILMEKWNLTDELRNLKIGQLNEIQNAKSEEELHFLLDTFSSKFNKSILDRSCHKNGLYNFPEKFSPFPWQSQAVDKWIKGSKNNSPYSGIVSVVTGAGKTVMALLAIKEYVKRYPNSKISIIVPTRVLMYQWARELSKYLAISSDLIGFRGDGFKDSFVEKKFLILIINSAVQDNFLKNDTSKINKEINHLLIADECHRYTGEIFQNVFNCRKEATLGLSATPIGEDELTHIENDTDSDSSILIRELGNIFYELNYRTALKDGLISEFTVNYIGVDLTQNERVNYDTLTKKLAKVLEKLRLRYGNRLDLMNGKSLDQKLQVILKSDDNPDSAIGQYFKLVRDRRDVVYEAVHRKGAFYRLLEDAIKNKRKTIVFHEKIDQLNEIVTPFEHREFIGKELNRVNKTPYEEKVDQALERLLYDSLYTPVMYHSGHEKDFWNRWSMQWFRDDTANTMLSVKALIEGVDVPAADVGIVRVSSSSVRQRIQATGRILRKVKGKRHSEMYVIFVKNTVDENIFRKYDWQKELGSSDIKLKYWHPNEDDPTLGLFEDVDRNLLPVKNDFEDTKPPLEVDITGLKPGDQYPGRYAGDLYHVAADGRPYKRSRYGRIFINNIELKKAGQLIRGIKGGGKFLVTPQGNIATRFKGQGTIFLGTINKDLIKQEIKQKYDSLETKKSKKKGIKIPTFEELFGSSK